MSRYAAALLLLCLAGSASAQLFTVDAGQGMAGQPSGGVVGVDFGTWTLEGSVGFYNDCVVGGAVARRQLTPNWSAAVGDQAFQVGLPAQMQFSSQVLARGVSTTYSPSPALEATAFAGVAGNGYLAPNLFYSAPQIPLGALSVDYFLDAGRHVKLFSRALVSTRQTLLGGLLYQSPQLQTGISVGVASNEPHAEGLLRYAGTQWEVRERYVLTGKQFELLTLPQFRTAQESGQNLDLTWSPVKGNALNVSQHQYLEPSGPSDPAASSTAPATFERGTIESAGAVLSVHDGNFGADVYQSRFNGTYGSAASGYASQKLSRKYFLKESYYRPLHALNTASILVLTAGENLNRRVTLTEFATRSNGQWTLNGGGTLRWDRFDVNVGYSTNYAPLAPGGVRFQQSLNVSGHVAISRWQVGVNTYAQPDGRVLYGYEIRSFYLHPMANGKVRAPLGAAPDFPQFLIEGRVLSADDAKPVANAPVAIADELVYTDEAGVFSLRVAHKRRYRVRAMTAKPIGGVFYEGVSVTEDVVAGTDDAPGKAELLLRLDAKRTAIAPASGLVVTTR